MTPWTKAQFEELEAYQLRLDEIDDLDALEELMADLKVEVDGLYRSIDRLQATGKVWTRFMHKLQARIQAVKADEEMDL